ncbi:MAG TPA: tubulin-like doman-containing protein [Anaerolineae bacterium]|nr:tubulin-like doman-containing protein [Anaerolineae bacterium]HQH36945.1 tubulin-like doman-containing protein [Anaerolineae bacterium]
MPKRVLAIGVGGSGKAALTILKERLEETYGQVPENVVLLSLDTDDLRNEDMFASTQLSGQTDERGRNPEFRHVISKPGVTMDTIFADIAAGRSLSYMQWLEKEKLSRILGPAERDIRGGAQQRRPVGRVALFQRWDNPIYSSIVSAIGQMYGDDSEEEKAVDAIKIEQSKRQIFIIGSVAGGTGSGFMVDVANLVGHAKQSNSKWQSLDVSAVIVLPDAFSSYTTMMNDPTNLKPNTYAALRELDRFVRTHSNMLPYMIRYGDDLRSITWSTNQPLDHIYLVDTTCPSAAGDMNLSGDPKRGVFPIISDFVMAHIDQTLGDALASMRSNAGLHYDKEEGWQYSSFNVYTYILPVDDIIESFSYRFLQELLRRQYLPIPDKKAQAQVVLAAAKEVERVFADTNVRGRVNPGVVQKAIVATKKIDPEMPDMSWSGLFNMIALSEGAFAEDYQTIQQWMDYLYGGLIATKDGEYKQESFDDGYTRLINFSDQFMDDCLGPQYNPDDEEAREGGQWDIILARYRDALRLRFSEALDVELLDILNRRDPRSKILVEAQLPMARALVAALKDRLVSFKTILEEEYRRSETESRLRQASEGLRDAIAWMQDTKEESGGLFPKKSKPRQAQDSYTAWFSEKMNLLLHRRIYRVVLDVLDALGAGEMDQSGNLSVVDQAAQELEAWQGTLQATSKVLQDWSRIHENNRREKRQIKVRRYLTSPEFEDQLYRQPEYVEFVAAQVLGEVRGVKGLTWERKDDTAPLDYKMVSMWAQEAKGAEDIARKFFAGSKELFQVVRDNISVADRIAVEFKSYSSFVNVVGQINEPFLRYNPSANGKSMGHERYISFNLAGATTEEAREFLDRARAILGDQGRTVNAAAESRVACTVVEVARGVKLRAVDQFIACENDYRVKLDRGKESIHLFPEEQIVTDYENMIEKLGEPENRMRPLSPELVIAMGDEDKLKIFTLACAYGLIKEGLYYDAETSVETTEVYLDLRNHGGRLMPLSESRRLRQLDKNFDVVPPEGQTARRYLNALQNFVLKATQKPGVPDSMIMILVDTLTRQGVDLGHIQNPFSLTLRALGEALRNVTDALGPDAQTEPDDARRQAHNAKRRIEKLNAFRDGHVAEFKKQTATQRVYDMGTIMHLILNAEIGRLTEIARKAGN